MPDGGAAVTRVSHDGSRREPPYSGPPPAQWPPLAGSPPPHEPPPRGCPQDRWPRHPASGMSLPTGENQQNRGSQLRHHGLYDGPHLMTPPRGPPPFQWHHSGGPPMPPFPYPFPWHFNPYNPAIASASYLCPAAPIPVSVNDDLCSVASPGLFEAHCSPSEKV